MPSTGDGKNNARRVSMVRPADQQIDREPACHGDHLARNRAGRDDVRGDVGGTQLRGDGTEEASGQTSAADRRSRRRTGDGSVSAFSACCSEIRSSIPNIGMSVSIAGGQRPLVDDVHQAEPGAEALRDREAAVGDENGVVGHVDRDHHVCVLVAVDAARSAAMPRSSLLRRPNRLERADGLAENDHDHRRTLR